MLNVSHFKRIFFLIGLIIFSANVATAQSSTLNVTIGASTRTGSSQPTAAQCSAGALSTTNFRYAGLTPDRRASGLDYIDVPANYIVKVRRHNGNYMQVQYTNLNNGLTRASFKHQEFARVCIGISPPTSLSQCLLAVDVVSFDHNKNGSLDLPDLRQFRFEFGTSGQAAALSIFNTDNDNDVDLTDFSAVRQGLSAYGLTSIDSLPIVCPENGGALSTGGSQKDTF